MHQRFETVKHGHWIFLIAALAVVAIQLSFVEPARAQAQSPAATETSFRDRYPDVWWWESLGVTQDQRNLYTFGQRLSELKPNDPLPEIYRLINPRDVPGGANIYGGPATFRGLFSGKTIDVKALWPLKNGAPAPAPLREEYRDFTDKSVNAPSIPHFFGVIPQEVEVTLTEEARHRFGRYNIGVGVARIDIFGIDRLSEERQRDFDDCQGNVGIVLQAFALIEEPNGAVRSGGFLWRRAILARAHGNDEHTYETICQDKNLVPGTPVINGELTPLPAFWGGNWRLPDGTSLLADEAGNLYRVDALTGCTRAPPSRFQILSLDEIERKVTAPLQAWGVARPATEWPAKALELLDAVWLENQKRKPTCNFPK